MGDFFGLSEFFGGTRRNEGPPQPVGGGVTNVTADGGLNSSGGPTPNITFDQIAKDTVMANITSGNALPSAVAKNNFRTWLNVAALDQTAVFTSPLTAPMLTSQATFQTGWVPLNNATIDLTDKTTVVYGDAGICTVQEQVGSESSAGHMLYLVCSAAATSLTFVPATTIDGVAANLVLVTGERALMYCVSPGLWITLYQQ